MFTGSANAKGFPPWIVIRETTVEICQRLHLVKCQTHNHYRVLKRKCSGGVINGEMIATFGSVSTVCIVLPLLSKACFVTIASTNEITNCTLDIQADRNMQSRTPKNIDNVVMKFCRSIVQNASPVHLVIKPASKAILNECFQNVRSKIECVDGSMCLGWSIWICPRVWIEAEFHAVHRSALGDTLNDISPSETPSLTTRLFLPDPSATYDFATPKNRVENHRQALANDPLIARAFEFAKQENELISKIPGFGLVTVSGVVAKKLSDIKNERMSNIHQLIRRFKGPNNPCPCDSGLKLKKCHRNLV